MAAMEWAVYVSVSEDAKVLYWFHGRRLQGIIGGVEDPWPELGFSLQLWRSCCTNPLPFVLQTLPKKFQYHLVNQSKYDLTFQASASTKDEVEEFVSKLNQEGPVQWRVKRRKETKLKKFGVSSYYL